MEGIDLDKIILSNIDSNSINWGFGVLGFWQTGMLFIISNRISLPNSFI